jgi:uncharacterized protein (TIGR02145 family)
VKIKALPYNYGDSLSSDTTWTVGVDRWLHYYFKGDMDEIRIYNRALKDTEIGELFNEGGYANFPTIITGEIDSITINSAISGGVIPDPAYKGIPMGLCWGTSPHPDTGSTKITVNVPYVGFKSKMTGLRPGTRYYVRAFALASAGVSYGNEIEFTTSLEFGMVRDIDGNEYKTVQIGNYRWMAENLRTTRYNDGLAIPNVTDGIEWATLDHAAYSWYKNDEAAYKVPYGAYYNRHVVTGSRNVCPSGWHVATPAEWSTLPCSLDGPYPGEMSQYYPCRELLAQDYWGHANNLTGFSAISTGVRQALTYYYLQPYGGFNGFGYCAFFWLADGSSKYLLNDDGFLYAELHDSPSEFDGYSIRCVEDLKTYLYAVSVNAILNETFEIPVLIRELPGNGAIAWQFNLAFDTTMIRYASCSIENTRSSRGMVMANVYGNTLSVAWAGDTAITSEDLIVKLYFRALKEGNTGPVLLNGLVNTDTIRHFFNTNIAINPAYGDADGNGAVQAFDASVVLQYSVGLDPLPVIDPLPWEDWRLISANVDSMEQISSYDASLILQHAVGLIHSFPVQEKEAPPPLAGVDVTAEEGYLVFRATGEVFGLNITVEKGNAYLGEPEFVFPDMLSASAISSGYYNVGLATSYPPVENQTIMRIPVENGGESRLAIDLIINGRASHTEVGLPTGISIHREGKAEIYPNPAHTDLYFRNLNGRAQITLYDSRGRELVSGIIIGNHFNISQMDNGLYFLRIEDDKNITTLKLLKE